ncbi:MAG: flavodoxin domain-containing protein [Anaerolineae bacterium]|nr:flavodoxin domain-containing protein [Anaerolineae bacterium]
MKRKVLVAYATKYGATAEIAEKIGETLQEAGLQAEVLPVEQVHDLAPYEAVVLGSAVYAGRWRREAATFLRTHEEALAQRPVWLFSTGPTGEGDPVQLMQGWRFPEDLQPVAERIAPRDIAFFHGALDPGKLNLGERLVIHALKAPTGDYRDWEAIAAWAAGIAQALKDAGP